LMDGILFARFLKYVLHCNSFKCIYTTYTHAYFVYAYYYSPSPRASIPTHLFWERLFSK
jgi:hypothetical protein